jgi:hypothetical protein
VSRYCECEHLRPYRSPDWEIDPDGGHCHGCRLPLHPKAVARMFAIALAERRRVTVGKPHLLEPPTQEERLGLLAARTSEEEDSER